MPTGPKGEKLPTVPTARAVKIMRVLTGEEPDDDGKATIKNQAAAEANDVGQDLLNGGRGVIFPGSHRTKPPQR